MQWRVLVATMIGYTLFYFMRKNFSFAMPGLEQDCGISKSQLGDFLFASGMVYGISKFINGFIGDRVNSRRMLCIGLFACALVNAMFGFVPSFCSGRTMVWAFGVLLVLNQFFQGAGFPPCARLIAHWVPPNELATKMSIWNTSHSVGGGMAAMICGTMMGLGVLGSANQGVGMWRWCFWTMAILGAFGVFAMWVWLPGTPEEERMSNAAAEDVRMNEKSPSRSAMKRVFLCPAIWMLGLCNFSINAVRALVADWGPTMLQEFKGLTASDSGTVIMLFEFSGILGMLISGWITDRFFAGRAPRLCAFLMVVTAAALVAFMNVPSAALASATLIVGGFALYGPQALTGVTATNLAGKSLTGTVIGFISLFSYVGVSVSGKLCGKLVQDTSTWSVPLLMMASTAVAGSVCFLTLWRTRIFTDD